MSETQPMHQEQPHKQKEFETNSTSSKNRKRKNRSKRPPKGGGGEGIVNSSFRELAGAAGDNLMGPDKNPLHTSMERLKVANKTMTPIANRKAAGSNWEAVIQATNQNNQQENKSAKTEKSSSAKKVVGLGTAARQRQKRRTAEKRYVAMDCEMVGVGSGGEGDMLARVSIVSKRGEVLLDKYVKPTEDVVDYRTSISGIRPQDIDNGEEFTRVQDEVLEMLQGKILIGHAIHNDLAVLHINHPDSSIRDTSRYKPLCRLVSNGRTPSLKRITQAVLGKEIQNGEHNSIEDARAAMSIYNLLASDWEAEIRRRQQKAGK